MWFRIFLTHVGTPHSMGFGNRGRRRRRCCSVESVCCSMPLRLIPDTMARRGSVRPAGMALGDVVRSLSLTMPGMPANSVTPNHHAKELLCSGSPIPKVTPELQKIVPSLPVVLITALMNSYDALTRWSGRCDSECYLAGPSYRPIPPWSCPSTETQPCWSSVKTAGEVVASNVLKLFASQNPHSFQPSNRISPTVTVAV